MSTSTDVTPPATPVRATAPHGKRYSAQVRAVSPESSRNTFEQHDACFLAVSLENDNFSTAKLAAMATWISRRFARCTVLIGDSIHRLTLESARGLAPDEARRQALETGRSFVERERGTFRAYGGTTGFTVLRCSDLEPTASFGAFHEELRDLFARNADFRASVEAFGQAYHDRHSAGVGAQERERRIAMSTRYFLEELALFACVRELGNPLMVYPGSFGTIFEMANGRHPLAPRELRDLEFVSLRLSKQPRGGPAAA